MSRVFATGGKLALHKCSWVLLAWAWTDGKANMGETTLFHNVEEQDLEQLILTQSEDEARQPSNNFCQKKTTTLLDFG